MAVDRTLEGLSQQMQRILEILREEREALTVREASEWKALALARWQMMQALDRFVSYKKDVVLDPVIAECDPHTLEQAKAIEARNFALREDYERFVHRWALNGPLAMDDPYRDEARKMSAVIESQVISDVQEIEALLRRRDQGAHAAGLCADLATTRNSETVR